MDLYNSARVTENNILLVMAVFELLRTIADKNLRLHFALVGYPMRYPSSYFFGVA